jgi:riboflavin kinase / FMN adenylyltransferase
LKLIRRIEEFSSNWHGGALTIGNFDGVHIGHALIAQRLCHWADQLGGPATVFTFDPHPARLLRPELAPPPLTWIDRKAELLGELGIDVLIAYPTSRELLQLEYQQFFDDIVIKTLGARAMVEGPNFYFGRNRNGDVKKLATLCAAHNMKLEIVEPEINDESFVSSSRIRAAISEGHVGIARQMLTQPYRIRGMVTHGVGRGASLGFPTANLDAIDTLIPAHGVYAGIGILDHTKHMAAIHIGPNPTFGEHVSKVEVHLLDFENAIYGNVLEVDFVEKIRDVATFDSSQQLMAQLINDVQESRNVLRNFMKIK